MKFSLAFTRKSGQSALADDAKSLAESLAALHGDVLLAHEKHGLHAYLACPLCLMADGDRELKSRHLAVNIDKHFGRGKTASGLRGHSGQTENRRTGCCMKRPEHVFSVRDLLEFAPLEKRNFAVSRRGRVTFTDNQAWLVPYGTKPDGTPIFVPGGPSDGTHGSSIPINSPEGRASPGGLYLLNRGYDLDQLWSMFATSFIVREFPENELRRYRKLPGGFRDSHQGRISFTGFMYGVPVIYQTRILDTNEVLPDGSKRHWVFNGQIMQWVCVAAIDAQGREFMMPGFNNPEFPWKPSKYRTGNGAQKSSAVMGLDAAIEWNRVYRQGQKSVGIVLEGPLDAGRLGSPAMATLGKFISTDQAELLARHFHTVILVPDNDAAGAETLDANKITLQQHVRVLVQRTPTHLSDNAGIPRQIKDVGDLTHDAAMTLKQSWIAQV